MLNSSCSFNSFNHRRFTMKTANAKQGIRQTKLDEVGTLRNKFILCSNFNCNFHVYAIVSSVIYWSSNCWFFNRLWFENHLLIYPRAQICSQPLKQWSNCWNKLYGCLVFNNRCYNSSDSYWQAVVSIELLSILL